MQILNCTVRHLLGRERANQHWSTSAFWGDQKSPIGGRVIDRIKVWKQDQQSRWDTGDPSELAENQTGFFGQEMRMIILDRWGELSQVRLGLNSLGGRTAAALREATDLIADARTEKARGEIFHDVKFETKGPRYEKQRPVGGDRVLVKMQLQLHMGIYKGVLDALLEEGFDRYGGGGKKATREAALGTETLLWETGQLPRDMPSPRRGRGNRR
jgi:hypothetical protein